jgi:hypothetical protein
MVRVISLQILICACTLQLAVSAERPILKPQDFLPLTELPWKKEGVTRESILDAIFREPDITIRYGALQLYLREIPVEQIEGVFDRAIELEGSETPDALVESMLRVWAEREPFRCWERVQKLFLVVGLEDGWLMFDDWDVERSSMLVQDRAAIQASPFRLRRWSLTGFPVGVERSGIPSSERVRLMKEFVQRWFKHFDTYPDSHPSVPDARGSYAFLEAFKVTADGAQSFYQGHHEQEYELAIADIALRRWLVAEPERAPYIMNLVMPKQPYSYINYSRVNKFLRLWAEVDRPGVMKWADSKETPKRLAITARGLLMSEVDAATRDRWISEAHRTGKDEDDLAKFQLECWGLWDPRAALEFAIKTRDTEMINDVAMAAVEGPYGDPMRPMRPAFDVVRDSDLRVLPRETWERLLDDWGMYPMENWGTHDSGATARFGFAQLEKFDWYGFPKDEVIEFFAGRNNEYRDNSSVIDRTFCSVRVWAATKPAEMKAWVATLKDEKLREALTWLADHPWGPGRF